MPLHGKPRLPIYLLICFAVLTSDIGVGWTGAPVYPSGSLLIVLEPQVELDPRTVSSSTRLELALSHLPPRSHVTVALALLLSLLAASKDTCVCI